MIAIANPCSPLGFLTSLSFMVIKKIRTKGRNINVLNLSIVISLWTVNVILIDDIFRCLMRPNLSMALLLFSTPDDDH